jgi:triacylglycerol lipase
MRLGTLTLVVMLLPACPEEALVQSQQPPATTAASDGGGSVALDASVEETPLAPENVVPVRVADTRKGPPYPILLVHGLNGFRDLGPVDYFFRVPGALTDAGEAVFVTAVAPYDGSAARAAVLARQLDAVLEATGARKVNLIAHSQGGLDSRLLISTLGYGDRVASLTTISTPHRGTAVADLLYQDGNVVAEGLINAWAWLFGEVSRDTQNNPNGRAALATLATANMAAFNQANVDDGRVQYFSFAGRTNLQQANDACAGSVWPNPDAVDVVEAALLPTWLYLAGSITSPTANDGLVTVDSARWGTFVGCLPADHADEIGQLLDLLPDLVSGWDHVDFYRRWVTELRQRGL